jgi:hypothetical protein
MFYRVITFLIFPLLAACSLFRDVPKAKILKSQEIPNTSQSVLSRVNQSYPQPRERFPALSESAGGAINVRDYGTH